MPLNAPVDGSALSHDASVGEAFKADPLVQAKVTVGVVDAMFSRVSIHEKSYLVMLLTLLPRAKS